MNSSTRIILTFLTPALLLSSCTQQQVNEFNRSLNRMSAELNAANNAPAAPNSINRLLVGTWNAYHSRHDTTYSFYPNGTYTVTDTLIYGGRERTSNGRGRWRVSGNRLSLNGTSYDLIHFPNTNTLIWRDGLGSTGSTTYERIH